MKTRERQLCEVTERAPFGIGEIDIGTKLDDLSDWFLLSTKGKTLKMFLQTADYMNVECFLYIYIYISPLNNRLYLLLSLEMSLLGASELLDGFFFPSSSSSSSSLPFSS